ncbi:MAG TPA: DUF4382 domain-containing protein [Steroidobacteraceae bacterium]|nr:DUF4382 domain-containing protein [Steroidobacteraceae bacterium]
MARRRNPLPALSLALGALTVLGGCSTRTNVSATGNSPSLYTHVYVTAQAVWFNSSATAGPDDAGWVKFTPSTPVTVDLVADSGGSFASLATDLKVPPGSYAQLRLIPVDAAASLSLPAQTLGAKYNMEADCLDGSGATHQLPLELLNPDKGLGVQASLSVPLGNIGGAFGALSSPGSTAPAATTATTTASITTHTTGTQTTTAEFALTFDGVRDLTAFDFGGTGGVCGDAIYGVLLSSHVSAYDLSRAGGIQGQLTLTNLSLTSANGTPGIAVSAEALSADGTRHFVVARAPVASDGSFTLYPLAASSSNDTSYDIVVHGPGIATIIIRNILIPATGRNGVRVTGTGTIGTATNPDTSPVTPSNLVSVGTLIPRTAGSYTANITTAAGSPLPAGAEVAFYQTLPSSGEVPYVIEAAPIDPFNQVLANPQSLSTGTLDSGTYVSSGATITVVSAAPQERAGIYQVAARAPLHADGPLGAAEVSATTTAVTVGSLPLAAGSTAASVSATVKPAANSSYVHGEIMLSQNGQLIAAAPLDAALAAGGGTVQLSGIPGGTPTSIYYLGVRQWTAGGTVARQWYPTPVDLRSTTSANVQLSVD